MKESFYVRIISFDGDKIVKEMGPFSRHQADKCDGGVNINLNHNEYYTLIVEGNKSQYGLGYMQGKGAA